MSFIKVHQDSKASLVNLCNVSDIYETTSNRSVLCFNFGVGDDPVTLTVEESLDEILELIKQVSQ